MNVLALSPACSPDLGSESLVGFRAVEAISDECSTVVISSASMKVPPGLRCEWIPVRFDDPNDVSAWQLLSYEFRQRRVVRRLLASERFDLVHRVTPSGLKNSLLPVPAAHLVLGPILLSERYPPAFDSIFRPELRRNKSLRGLVRRAQHAVARRMFRRWSTLPQLLGDAAVILVGTRATLRQLPPQHHPRCRLVTYAGVEHDIYRPAPRKKPNRVPQVLYAGRIVPYKGVELLLRAAAQARQSCRFEVRIVGDGEDAYRRHCLALAAKLKLQDTVQFLDRQSRTELAEVYRIADVFCMPSVETYGLAILEAMSSGCAVLVSDINGPGEIVSEDTGVKVPLKSPEQFIGEYAEKLVALLEDARWRQELGECARNRAVTHHDWRRIRDELAHVYAELLSDREKTRQSVTPYAAAL